MRDILIHEYFGVNLDLTWEVVKRDIPDLKKKMIIELSVCKSNENRYNVFNQP